MNPIIKTNQRNNYTSLDLMKFFAVLNMTIDHIGFYFFPDILWLRVPSRITIAIWFFLVGYSQARHIPKDIWIYAILLLIPRIIFHDFLLLPFNVLFSVILSRYVINFCEDRNFFQTRLPEIIAICIILSVFTMDLFEYGSLAFLFAIYGRLIREKQTKNFYPFMAASYLMFIVWEIYLFKFSLIQSLYVIIGTGWVVWWLAHFSNQEIWSEWKDSTWKTVIVFISRNTALYYFLHRLIFELIANYWTSSI